MDELYRMPPGQYIPRSMVSVVLDDVRSRHNVGSIFRTADSFGVRSIALCGLTPCPPHREIEKTALGATASVPWTHHREVLVPIRQAREAGDLVIAVEQTVHAISLGGMQVPIPRPVTLVFGNELSGVSDRVISECDHTVIIPQHGSKHSLNVSVCAGIVLWWLCGAGQ